MLLIIHVIFQLINIYDAKPNAIFMKLPEFKINETEVKMDVHLSYEHIRVICNNSDNICKSNSSIICGMRFVNDTIEYKEFGNSCFMFLSNMCVYPREEFYIVSSGNCKEYKTRRQSELVNSLNTTNTVESQTVTPEDQFSTTKNTPLRSEDTFSPLYDLETSYDYHICPHSCPDIYKPECVLANRGMGKYFKFFTFANHCVGDMYYCKHYEEFAPPEDESENVHSSPLGWSYCGSSRYMQFAGFAEAASSLGHYGWLSGDQRYTHIMEPHQRLPGYGRK